MLDKYTFKEIDATVSSIQEEGQNIGPEMSRFFASATRLMAAKENDIYRNLTIQRMTSGRYLSTILKGMEQQILQDKVPSYVSNTTPPSLAVSVGSEPTLSSMLSGLNVIPAVDENLMQTLIDTHVLKTKLRDYVTIRMENSETGQNVSRHVIAAQKMWEEDEEGHLPMSIQEAKALFSWKQLPTLKLNTFEDVKFITDMFLSQQVQQKTGNVNESSLPFKNDALPMLKLDASDLPPDYKQQLLQNIKFFASYARKLPENASERLAVPPPPTNVQAKQIKILTKYVQYPAPGTSLIFELWQVDHELLKLEEELENSKSKKQQSSSLKKPASTNTSTKKGQVMTSVNVEEKKKNNVFGIEDWEKLAKSRELADDYFVRMLYNFAPVTIPGCRPHLVEGQLCPFNVFRDHLTKHTMTPLEQKVECDIVEKS
jgi:hypothetical protein